MYDKELQKLLEAGMTMEEAKNFLDSGLFSTDNAGLEDLADQASQRNNKFDIFKDLFKQDTSVPDISANTDLTPEQQVEADLKSGKITEEEANRLQSLSSTQLSEEYSTNGQAQTDEQSARQAAMLSILGTPASNLNTELYNLGRGIGTAKGTKGRGTMIAGNLGAGLLDISRNIASGIGYSKANANTQNYYNDMLNRRKYNRASQTTNNNYLGGYDFKYGGEKEYEEGGEMTEEEAMMLQQMQQQNPQEEASQIDQVMEQVVSALQQGADPNQVLQQLVQSGVPQEQATQMIQQAMQMLQQGGEEEVEVPTMRGGGTFRHKVGDTVEFEYGGKMHKGKISKIENGKFYL